MTVAAAGLEKAKIRRTFGAASGSYDSVAVLQRTVGERLLAEHVPAGLHGTVVDLGCGTGFITGKLAGFAGWDCLIAVDMALPMLQLAHAKVAYAEPLCADMEALPLRSGSVDWIVSNLALQWSSNWPLLAEELRRVLKVDGRLAFTTFGPGTLRELRFAWSVVDSYTHVNMFHSPEDIERVLTASGFGRIALDIRTYTTGYASVIDLMRELKTLGAHHVTDGRKRAVTTQSQLQTLCRAYESLRTGGLLPASFETLSVTAVGM